MEGKEGNGKEGSLSPASCEARDAHPTKGVRECPEDFQPDLPTLQTLYAEGFSERDVYDAVASMKDWSRGGGKRKKDWNAVLRNWLRNDKKRSHTGPAAKTRTQAAIERMMRDVE